MSIFFHSELVREEKKKAKTSTHPKRKEGTHESAPCFLHHEKTIDAQTASQEERRKRERDPLVAVFYS